MPSLERKRLGALDCFRILDTPPEPEFDALTSLAAEICGTPIALISLIAEDRQWFKARIGLTMRQGPREHAFCAHTILRCDPLVVGDASRDARFRDNPLVRGEPGIRFYAGVPLKVAEDVSLGALCVMDRRPRRLRADQLHALEVLRDAIVARFELDRLRRRNDDAERMLSVCAWCDAVRVVDQRGVGWQRIKQYLMDHHLVSHAICPRCRATLEKDGEPG